MACGTLVLQPGIKPVPSALEDGVLTAGPLRKSLSVPFLISHIGDHWNLVGK